MTIEQLREKIAYRTNKMNWCISVGRETQAEWNRDQIARLEDNIQAIEAQQDQEAIDQRLIERNTNRGRGNVQHHYVPPNDIQPTVRNRPARNTDEDFDYV